jgi:hypothetical protein
LVGVGEGGFEKIGEIGADEVPEAKAPAGTSFTDLFARALAKKPTRPTDDDPGGKA